jgi:predicted type IV restriction endonuclease
MALDIRKPLKRLLPYLLKAREDNLSEADTVQRIIKVFEEVLGYDSLSEISRECQIRDKYVDIALKIDGAIRLLVEAKAAGTELRDRHIEQAQHYAAVGNIPWVVLTNGVAWTLYHLSFDEGVEYVRAFSVDLASDPVDEVAGRLGLLHRQSFVKDKIADYWQHRTALRPESIARALFHEETLKLIRREIRRRESILIDEEDLARAIHEMFSTETRELLGPPRVRRKAKARSLVKARQPTGRVNGCKADGRAKATVARNSTPRVNPPAP